MAKTGKTGETVSAANVSGNVFPRFASFLATCFLVLCQVCKCQTPAEEIDLMHDDLTLPKGSIVVVVTLKSKMAASSASSGENSKST